jgi:hypothetical protein
MAQVEAARAKRSIKKMLLGEGGSAQVRIAKTTRMLSHSAMDRPLRKLPWLSVWCSLTAFAIRSTKETKRWKKKPSKKDRSITPFDYCLTA